MKLTLTYFLFLIAITASSQQPKINKSIDDNGKTMKVKISGQSYGRDFKYSNTFDVKGMDASEKDSIINDVLNILNLEALKEANKRYKITKSIDDDGEIMEVRIKGEAYGREVEFMKRFNVTGMIRSQKDSIVNFLMDSLQVSYKSIIYKKPVVNKKKDKK